MFGFSWSEILIIGVVALVFIGPNDLPKAMKTAARWMSAARKLAREFQSHVDDLVREAELDELREQARKLATQPLSALEAAVDPDKVIAKAMAAPDNLHELMTGSSPVAPVEGAATPALEAAPEAPAEAPPEATAAASVEAPGPTSQSAAAPKPRRKPAAKKAESEAAPAPEASNNNEAKPSQAPAE
jgi:sec-independent protein translocase protein TatB